MPRLSRSLHDHYLLTLAEMQRHELSSLTVDEYYAVLAPWLDDVQYVAAMRSIFRDDNPYWPKPGAILKAAGVEVVDAATARCRVQAIVKEQGAAAALEAARTMPPVIRRALKAAGGIDAMAEAMAAAARGDSRGLVAIQAAFAATFTSATAWTPPTSEKAVAIEGKRTGTMTRAIGGGR